MDATVGCAEQLNGLLESRGGGGSEDGEKGYGEGRGRGWGLGGAKETVAASHR